MKRIGYLPSVNIQKITINIATKEKVSQSRFRDILVEEALIARGIFDNKNINNSIHADNYRNGNRIIKSDLKNCEIDELI